MTVTIKIRRDTAAKWTSINPVLSAGEPGFETDTLRVKYGDGVHAWNNLAYASTPSGTFDPNVTKTIRSTVLAMSVALS
jgi:hypothetical protein